MIEGITFIDVCRELGVDLNPQFTWSVGALVRNAFVAEYGHLPPKDNRRKTNNPKSVHCFAIYPRPFRKTIAEIIRANGPRSDPQLRLPL
jgi:hypothetical protein